MRPLLEHLDEFLATASEARHLCVLSDFDGTLAPLELRPDRARLADASRELLRSLARQPRTTVGILSGRSLDDLRSKVGLDRLWYVGNHGYEVSSPSGEQFLLYDPLELEVLTTLEEDLRSQTAGIPGVLLEPKGPILALHFREVAPEAVERVERIFQNALEQRRRKLMVSRGHCVLEARLRGSSNKGTAVRRIRGTLPSGTLVIYAGDDLTDQDVFRELRGRGCSIAIGAPTKLADYTLPGPGDWDRILERLLKALQARSAPPRSGRTRTASE